MRSSRLPAALIALFALTMLRVPAACAADAGTDAFVLQAPGGAWKRATPMDPPGRLTWVTSDPKSTSGQLRVTFEGVRALDPQAAINEILEREKNIIKAGSDHVDGIERGNFTTESLVSGKLHWYGIHVDVKTGQRAGAISRWVALHPDFPRRRRAYFIALDEETAPGARTVSRLPDALAALRSLTPRGVGLAGGLAEAYLDARAAAFAARIDSTTRLCWRSRGPDASPQRAFIGVGRGLALEGDFHEVSDVIPRDSVVDAGTPDYGAVFDRNGDGKVDLIVLNRGICAARGAVVLPIAVVLADDNFDGQIDGSVLENGDADGDGRLDYRLMVLDTDHDGRPDQAVRFTDGMLDKTARTLKLKDGVVEARIVGNDAKFLDFGSNWREAAARLEELNRVRATCPQEAPSAR